MRVCPRCRTAWPIAHFPPRPDGRLHSHCRQCELAAACVRARNHRHGIPTPPPDRTSHAARMSYLRRAGEVTQPWAVLALAVISLCLEDREHGRPCDLDVQFWADLAGVQERWIIELLHPDDKEAAA